MFKSCQRQYVFVFFCQLSSQKLRNLVGSSHFRLLCPSLPPRPPAPSASSSTSASASCLLDFRLLPPHPLSPSSNSQSRSISGTPPRFWSLLCLFINCQIFVCLYFSQLKFKTHKSNLSVFFFSWQSFDLWLIVAIFFQICGCLLQGFNSKYGKNFEDYLYIFCYLVVPSHGLFLNPLFAKIKVRFLVFFELIVYIC